MSATSSMGSGICRYPHEKLFLRLRVVYIRSGVVSHISLLYFSDSSSSCGSLRTLILSVMEASGTDSLLSCSLVIELSILFYGVFPLSLSSASCLSDSLVSRQPSDLVSICEACLSWNLGSEEVILSGPFSS
jgi:hypothetical protein